MSSSFYLVATVVISLAVLITGQKQELKVILPGVNDDTVIESQYVASEGAIFNDTGNGFADADRICVYGIWALYNTVNYGVGFESTTTVISVVGKSNTKLECSYSGQITGLRNVKSVRYFGDAHSGDGISILSEAFLLGGSWDVKSPGTDGVTLKPPSQPSGVRLGSLAITGTNQWLLCSDPGCAPSICVDMSLSRFAGIFFLNRDTVGDRRTKWPLVVNTIKLTNKTVCSQMIQPNYNRNLWRTDSESSDEKEITLDFHVYSPMQNFTTDYSSE